MSIATNTLYGHHQLHCMLQDSTQSGSSAQMSIRTSTKARGTMLKRWIIRGWMGGGGDLPLLYVHPLIARPSFLAAWTRGALSSLSRYLSLNAVRGLRYCPTVHSNITYT